MDIGKMLRFKRDKNGEQEIEKEKVNRSLKNSKKRKEEEVGT